MSQPQPIDPRYVGRPPVRKKRRNWFGRIIGLIVLLFLLVLISVPLYAWGKIDKVDAFPAGKRPAETPGTTYLMVGSDSREGLSAAEKKKLGTGSSPGQRTDSIMLMHVPESGPTVLISVPRDSWLPIPGHGKDKINAAFAFSDGGPKLLIQALENYSGLHIDHYVEVGFGGFASIIDNVGGVQMCLPTAMKDPKAHINLPKGCQQLDGTKALGYVRSRHVGNGGDLARVQRQREMIGAVAGKAVSWKTFINPVRYYNVATSGADALTVDKEMGPLDLFRFARGMKAVSSGGSGITLTLPVANPDYRPTPDVSAVKLDDAKSKALFKALKEDKTSGLKST
jgi:LCP family protein required for cell wall assembly